MRTLFSRFSTFFALLAVLAIATGASTARAQLLPDGGGLGLAAAAPQPYRVGTVTIRFVGTANVNEAFVRANMQVREGVELDDTMIDRDIRALYKTGLFEYIEFKREILPNRIINIVAEVTPRYRIQEIRYEGNENVKSSTLEKETKARQNQALDERQIKEDTQKIHDYYQKRGYSRAYVNYEIQRDTATGYGTVTFKIREGNKVKIADIVFTGNNSVKASALAGIWGSMETKPWWLFSWLTGSGYFKDEMFEDDLEKLRDHYRELGFLDVEISTSKVKYEYPAENKLRIIIHIDEGRQYRIGNVTFTGNKLYPTQLFQLLVQTHPGMIYSPSRLDKDVETIENFYGKDGYLETSARIIRRPNIATGHIDIEFQITESDQYFVESIKIEGNTKTKSTVIIRELTLGPGEVFDKVRMNYSKARLENTRFFEDVNISPETTNIPGRRNLKIALTEGRTGNLQFGAGFSSLEKAMVFAEVSQGNFDIFNRRGFWQGAGQKARLRLQLGQVSSEATLSFEEPWFLQKELALGFSVYRTTTNYDNQFYNVRTIGGQVYLRKRLFELFEGMLSYAYNDVAYTDIQEGYQYMIPSLHDRISQISIQILRDTRDRLVNTRDGGRIEFTASVAGGWLGGSDDFYQVEARGSQFFPVFRFQNQVVSIIARVGVVDAYGRNKKVMVDPSTGRSYSKGVNYNNKYFLGGPYTLRGFEYRDVGPKQDGTGYFMGGNTYGLLSIEYSFDIVDPVRFAFFYDAGFVNTRSYDFSPIHYNDNFGFGLRLFVAGSPLSLDFGIPLTGDKFNRKGNQFNFSFGTRF